MAQDNKNLQNNINMNQHQNQMNMNSNVSNNSSIDDFVNVTNPNQQHQHQHQQQQQQQPMTTTEQKYDPSTEPEQNANGNNNNNNNDPNDNRKRVTKCEPFQPHKPKQPGLRANVFVSKDCTRDLSEHIVEENWGNEHGMLYKYLDYIFRCQIFDKQVKKITYSTNQEIVVFHTGLQRRDDHEFLYFVLKSNDPEKRNAEQRWRVPAGNITNSCFSKGELTDKWLLSENHLPQRTKFYNSLQELLFDESYEIEVNWPERLRTNKERIYQELKQASKDIDKSKLVSELSESFAAGLKKAENQAKANPRLAVAQGFVETKHYKKRVELLLPLKIEYPKDSKRYHTFALALRKVDNTKKYTGMSLLTMSMAYANARLVGYVDSSWLTNEAIASKKDKKGDKDRDQHHSAPKQSFNPLSVNQPKGGTRYRSMTFASNHSSTNRNVARSRGGMMYGMGSYAPASLPPIPDAHIVGVNEVNLGDDNNVDMNGMSFPTTNMQQPQNNYYQQQAQQKYNPQYPMQQMQQPQMQQPFIDNASQIDEVDDNAPLSTYGHPQDLPPQNMNDQQRRGYHSGQALQPQNNLRYARSALPVMNTQPEPELHNPMPENDEEEANDDIFNNNNPPLFPNDELKLETPRRFPLDDDTEEHLQDLKYYRSEPPIKSSASKTLPSKFKQPLRKKYQSPLSPNQAQAPQQIPTTTIKQATLPQAPPPIRQHYHSDSVARLPEKVQKYAQPNTQQFGVVPYVVTEYHKNSSPNDTRSLKSAASDSQKWLLQLSRLPGDCGVNTLRQIFTASGCKLQSVHLVDDDKTAVIRFPDQTALKSAAEFVSKFKWRSKIVQDSPYLKNYDQQRVWQYQESTKWRAHHAKMAELIERIPPRTDLIIEHGNRKYFIEKYNKQQGRQTNLRTKNQRMIRRIRIHVWAPKTNPIWSKAIPRIVPQHPQETYDDYFGLPQQGQIPPQHNNNNNQPSVVGAPTPTHRQQQPGPFGGYPQHYEHKEQMPAPQHVVSTRSHQSGGSHHTASMHSNNHQQQQNTQLSGVISGAEAESGLDPKAAVWTPHAHNHMMGGTQPQPAGIAPVGLVQAFPNPNHNNYNHPNRQTLQSKAKINYVRSTPPKPDVVFNQRITNPASKIPPSAASSNNKNGPMSVIRVTKTFNNWDDAMDDPDEPDIEILMEDCQIDPNQCSGLWLYVGHKAVIKPQMSNGHKKETLYYVPNANHVEDVMDNGVRKAQSLPFFSNVRKAIETFSDAQDENNNVTVFLCEVILDQNQQNELNQNNQVKVTDMDKIEFLVAMAININILKGALKL